MWELPVMRSATRVEVCEAESAMLEPQGEVKTQGAPGGPHTEEAVVAMLSHHPARSPRASLTNGGRSMKDEVGEWGGIAFSPDMEPEYWLIDGGLSR